MSISGKGGMYTVAFEDIAITTAVDLFSVTVPAGKQYVIHEARVAQTTDAGASEAEQLQFKVKRFWNGQTAGSGGTAAVPTSLHGRDRRKTAPASWRTNDTTQTSGSNSALLYVTSEDVQVGLSYIPKRESEPIVIAGETFVITLDAPADSITTSGVVVFEIQSSDAHI